MFGRRGHDDRGSNPRPVIRSELGFCWRVGGTAMRRLLVIGFTLISAVACDRGDTSADLGTAVLARPARLISVDPQRLLETDELRTERRVFEWDLRSSAAASAWEDGEGDAHLRLTSDGMVLSAARGRIAINREVNLDADRVDAIEVSVEGFFRGSLRIGWAAPDHAFDTTRTWELLWADVARMKQAAGGEERVYRFDVSGHPLWRGRVGRIQLSASVLKGDELIIRNISGLRHTANWKLLRRAAESPWKVDLGHEVRNALLAVPDRPVEATVAVRAGDSLRFAVGVEPTTRRPVRFRIAADLGREGRELQLWQHVVNPAAGESGRWHQAEIDLAAAAGREVRLRLSTELADEKAIDEGFAFWAGLSVIGATSAQRQTNVLLISVDALRADHLSLYGYDRNTSPHLATWSEARAAVFQTVVAPTPWTLPSHISLFSGLEALRHGFNHDVGGIENEVGAEPNSSLEMMAELFWQAGYATGASTGGAYLHPKYGFSRGFDVYSYWPNRAQDEGELRAGVARALQWLQTEGEGPRFFFLHTYVVHDPFRARQPYFSAMAAPGTSTPDGVVAVTSPKAGAESGFQQVNRLVLRPSGGGGREIALNETDAPLVRAMYDSGVAYMDEKIGGLLRELEAGQVARPTVVVFTSDHGEALLEHGLAGHIDLYDHTLLVPLVIALPDGRGAGVRVKRQVRLIDVLPTVLEVLGLEAPVACDGVSLLPFLEDSQAAVPEVAWSYSSAPSYGVSLRLDSGQKYIFNNSIWPPHRHHEEFYDLNVDPFEYHDLSRDDRRVEPFRGLMRRHLETSASALRLRLANSSTGWLRGEVLGDLVRREGIKSPDLPCDCIHRPEMGRAAFEVPPGTSFTLYFEKVLGHTLTIDGALDVGGRSFAVRHTFSVRDLDGIATLRFDGSQWISATAETQLVTTGFSLWWHGSRALSAPSPAESDPELLNQLRALGYVE